MRLKILLTFFLFPLIMLAQNEFSTTIRSVLGPQYVKIADPLLINLLIDYEHLQKKSDSPESIYQYRKSLHEKSERFNVRLAENDQTLIGILLKIRKGTGTYFEGLNNTKTYPGNDFDVISGTISPEALLLLIKDTNIVRVEPSYRMYPFINQCTQDINAHEVWTGNASIPDCIDGTGVYLGILDGAPNRSHITFQDAQGNCRFLNTWELPPDDHGTHVAGIAGGRGDANGNFRGVAYNSILLWDTLASGEPGKFNISSAELQESVQNMISISGSNPLVINHSAGYYFGPHDGTTILEQSLNNLLTGNKIMVNAAGNAGPQNDDIFQHIYGIVPNDTTQPPFEALFQVFPNSVNTNKFPTYLEFWHNGLLDVTVSDHQGNFTNKIGPGGYFIFNSDDDDTIIITNSESNSYQIGFENCSQASVISLILDPGEDETFQPGTYLIRFYTHQQGVSDTLNGYHVKYNCHKYGRFINGDSCQTLAVPSMAEKVICVSAHRKSTDNNGNWANYSSCGPLRTDALPVASKPDIAAPGGYFDNTLIQIAGASHENNRTFDNYQQGTSMSAPFVAGSIALLLQNFPQLTVDQVKNILTKSAGSLPNGHQGSNITYEERCKWGSGKLDIFNAYKMMVGFNYDSIDHDILVKFKCSYENAHDGLTGLPVEPVNTTWSSFSLHKQRLSNGAIIYNPDYDTACWLGEGIWTAWLDQDSVNGLLGMPITTEYVAICNNNYPAVDFENGKIIWDGTQAITSLYFPGFYADNLFGDEPLLAHFFDTTSVVNGYVAGWNWDFGDGITSDLQNPVHYFLNEGFYNITFTVFDQNRGYSITKNNYIQVGDNAVTPLLVGLEYFFDNDPGTGNGVYQPVNPSTSFELNLNPDIDTLPVGIHRIYFRVMNENGVYTQIHSKTFTIIPDNANDTTVNLIQAIYSFDSIPDVDSGNSFVIVPGNKITINDTINLNTLAGGNHRIYFKVKNESGSWSLPQFSDFILYITKTWMGTIDDEWNNAGNWSPAGIPSATDNLIISGIAPYMPIVRVQGMSCHDLLIMTNASVIIQPGVTLLVNGNISFEEE